MAISMIYRFWTLADDCGNDTTITQLITLVDIVPPSMIPPADITLSCTDDPYDLGLTGQLVNVSDNCSSGILNSIFSDSIVVSDLCEQNVIIYRTWAVEDACGNDTMTIQVISIQDVVPPVFTVPEGITLECRTRSK